MGCDVSSVTYSASGKIPLGVPIRQIIYIFDPCGHAKTPSFAPTSQGGVGREYAHHSSFGWRICRGPSSVLMKRTCKASTSSTTRRSAASNNTDSTGSLDVEVFANVVDPIGLQWPSDAREVGSCLQRS